MSEEQAEVVGNARDVFQTECVLDVAAVTRVTALSDLTHDVVTEKPTEGKAEQDKRKLGKFTVLTNLVAVVEGEVKYVQCQTKYVLTNLVAELRRQGSPEV